MVAQSILPKEFPDCRRLEGTGKLLLTSSYGQKILRLQSCQPDIRRST
jgi:hypothetical protein